MIFGGGEARDPWRCGASAKMRNDATVKKHPACGGANRLPGFVAALARYRASRGTPRLPGKPICHHQIDPIWPDSALDPRTRSSRRVAGFIAPLPVPVKPAFSGVDGQVYGYRLPTDREGFPVSVKYDQTNRILVAKLLAKVTELLGQNFVDPIPGPSTIEGDGRQGRR